MPAVKKKKKSEALENEKENSEIRVNDALTSYREALRIKTETENEQAKVELRSAQIKLEKDEANYARTKAADSVHRVYQYVKKIDGDSTRDCMSQLTEWSRIFPGEAIEIKMCSPGGLLIEGMALFDFITDLRSTCDVNITGVGEVCSMASVLLQAATRRKMGKNAWMMVHAPSAGISGPLYEMEDWVKVIGRMEDQIARIFRERSGLPEADIKARWERKDNWLDAHDALRMKFIDEIV